MGIAFFVVFIAFIFGVVLYLAGAERKRLVEFARALAADADLELVAGPGSVRCRTRRPPFIDLVCAGGGKNNPPRWDASGSAARTAARTWLHVSPEGAVGALRERLGISDVHLGDQQFDDAFTVRGSDADVVRGILAHTDVKFALRVVFAVPATSVDLRGDDGLLIARFPRHGYDVAQVKRGALALARLVEVLELHADDAPVPDARSPLVAGASGGGASGAPVAVPLAVPAGRGRG